MFPIFSLRKPWNHRSPAISSPKARSKAAARRSSVAWPPGAPAASPAARGAPRDGSANWCLRGQRFQLWGIPQVDNVHNIYIYIPIGSMYAIYGNIYHPYIYIYIQWIGLREHLNRKPWFWPSNWLGFPVNCPIIQFYDRYIYIYMYV